MATKPTTAQRTRTASLFGDIRTIIGALLGAYGVILTLMGLFGDTEPEKTGDVNANLWAGLALLVVGATFLTWAIVRPVVVRERPAADTDRTDA